MGHLSDCDKNNKKQSSNTEVQNSLRQEVLDICFLFKYKVWFGSTSWIQPLKNDTQNCHLCIAELDIVILFLSLFSADNAIGEKTTRPSIS